MISQTRSLGKVVFSFFTSFVRFGCNVETYFLTAAFSLLIAIPLLERLLRQFTSFGISGASEFVQHLTLIIAMLGASVAAREDRLLSIATVSQLVSQKSKNRIRIIAHSVALAVVFCLGLASIHCISTERESPKEIAYGIPIWWIQLILPLGFVVIAWRIFWNTAKQWQPRLLALAGTTIILMIFKSSLSPQTLWIFGLALILLATLLGAPIFTILGGVSLLYFYVDETPIESVVVSHYSSLAQEELVPTLPLFTLTGFILAESKASDRLVAVFKSLVGPFRIGAPLITVLVCAFFTAFTGGSGVTILALGPLLLPLLLASRCPQPKAMGLLCGAGSLGILFPPALPVILYFIVASVNGERSFKLEQLFLGGLIPGILMLGILAFWGARQIPAAQIETKKFSAIRAWSAIKLAKWELLLPMVALGSLFSGLFSTPVAAAAMTAFYALLIETLVHRDLHFTKDIPRVFSKCGLLVGGVLLIFGMASALTNALSFAQVPDKMMDWVNATIESRWVFLLTLNLLLILVGCLMDIYSAIIVVVPLIIPLGSNFGIDPIHLAILFLVNLELGYLTPPVGMNLFLAAYRFEKPILEVARAAIPILFLFLIAALLVTFVPALTTFLPSLLK